MHLRAWLLCEDVRFEASGAVSLMGVHGETVYVEAEGPILLARIATYVVVSGLRGIDVIEWSQCVSTDGVLTQIGCGRDLRAAEHDEHRIIALVSPISLPRPGEYQLVLGLEAGGKHHRFSQPFRVATASELRWEDLPPVTIDDSR